MNEIECLVTITIYHFLQNQIVYLGCFLLSLVVTFVTSLAEIVDVSIFNPPDPPGLDARILSLQ